MAHSPEISVRLTAATESESSCSSSSSTTESFASQRRVERGYIGKDILKSVVKVFAVKTEPNYTMPWQMRRQQSSTSSGFAISGRRIITNAHSVAYQTSVRVRKHGSAEKYIAKVTGVGHTCDLAVLTVADEAFWEDIVPLDFGDVPNLQESVTVVGYPTGGDNISVTKGVVSRIEETIYSHASSRLLAIQIDAAINAGNSGGPAFLDNKVVGVCFETLTNAENIGYIIPIPVVQHFLQDISRHSHYTGFCELGVTIQHLECEHMRRALGMTNGQTGVLLNKVLPLADAANYLRKDDVLLAIDDVPIGNDGTIPFRDGERISVGYALLKKFVGDKCKLKLLRQKQVLEMEIAVGEVQYLVPVQQYDILPSYYIYAGLVFSPLTQPYLFQEWGKEWRKKAPVKFVDRSMSCSKEFPDQEVVILSQVLAADLNVGYHKLAGQVVVSCNGVPVRNLRHLVSLVEDCTQQPFMRIDLENERVIILDHKEALEFSVEILKNHNIPSPKSADLMGPTPIPKAAMAHL
jgi:S1-C subfamily serine protease